MKVILFAVFANFLFFSSLSYARNDIGDYPIQQALNSDAAVGKLNDVKLFFGTQKPDGTIEEKGFGKVNKKTNAFNKSDETACEWVFLSAVIALQRTAEKKGANAVINIKSNYQNNLTSSNETFQCGAGALLAGVALTGEYVLIK